MTDLKRITYYKKLNSSIVKIIKGNPRKPKESPPHQFYLRCNCIVKWKESIKNIQERGHKCSSNCAKKHLPTHHDMSGIMQTLSVPDENLREFYEIVARTAYDYSPSLNPNSYKSWSFISEKAGEKAHPFYLDFDIRVETRNKADEFGCYLDMENFVKPFLAALLHISHHFSSIREDPLVIWTAPEVSIDESSEVFKYGLHMYVPHLVVDDANHDKMYKLMMALVAQDAKFEKSDEVEGTDLIFGIRNKMGEVQLLQDVSTERLIEIPTGRSLRMLTAYKMKKNYFEPVDGKRYGDDLFENRRYRVVRVDRLNRETEEAKFVFDDRKTRDFRDLDAVGANMVERVNLLCLLSLRILRDDLRPIELSEELQEAIRDIPSAYTKSSRKRKAQDISKAEMHAQRIAHLKHYIEVVLNSEWKGPVWDSSEENKKITEENNEEKKRAKAAGEEPNLKPKFPTQFEGGQQGISLFGRIRCPIAHREHKSNRQMITILNSGIVFADCFNVECKKKLETSPVAMQCSNDALMGFLFPRTYKLPYYRKLGETDRDTIDGSNPIYTLFNSARDVIDMHKRDIFNQTDHSLLHSNISKSVSK